MSEVTTYIAQVAQYPLLTPEQERLVFKRVAAGDKRAREQAITNNLRLALSFSKKYVYLNPEMPAMDIIQQANLGIIRAVDMFDVSKGTKFSTFAMESMQFLITRYIHTYKNLVRVPDHQFNVAVDMVDNNLVALDAPAAGSDSEETLGARVAGGDAFQSFNTREFWARVDMYLSEREAKLIRLRYQHDMEQAEVGKHMGMTKQNVSLIQIRALKKLESVGLAA